MKRMTTLSSVIVAALSISGYAMAAGTSTTGSMQMGMSSDCPARSQVDGNGNGTVSDREARKHRDEVFASLDANSDNIVSKQEYTNCLQSLQQAERLDLYDSAMRGKAQGAAAGTEAFSALDADGDGYVSSEEFMSKHKSQFESQARGGKIDMQPEAQGSAEAGAADIDGNGSLSADEAAAEAARSFSIVDANRDGRISKQEWQAWSERQEKGQMKTGQQKGKQQDFTKAFNEIDSDRNGAISKSEFNRFGNQVFADARQSGEPVDVWVYREYYVY